MRKPCCWATYLALGSFVQTMPAFLRWLQQPVAVATAAAAAVAQAAAVETEAAEAACLRQALEREQGLFLLVPPGGGGSSLRACGHAGHFRSGLLPPREF